MQPECYKGPKRLASTNLPMFSGLKNHLRLLAGDIASITRLSGKDGVGAEAVLNTVNQMIIIQKSINKAVSKLFLGRVRR